MRSHWYENPFLSHVNKTHDHFLKKDFCLKLGFEKWELLNSEMAYYDVYGAFATNESTQTNNNNKTKTETTG